MKRWLWSYNRVSENSLWINQYFTYQINSKVENRNVHETDFEGSIFLKGVPQGSVLGPLVYSVHNYTNIKAIQFASWFNDL